jgi:hypothetical protein
MQHDLSFLINAEAIMQTAKGFFKECQNRDLADLADLADAQGFLKNVKGFLGRFHRHC